MSRKIASIKEKRMDNYITGLTAQKNTDYSLWKAVKYLKKPVVRSNPLKKGEGRDSRWVKSRKEKAELFADHLAKVFQPNPPQENNQDFTEEEFAELNPFPFSEITQQEVCDMIKYKIKVKKAPGMDKITGQILRELPAKAVRKLVLIFNATLRLEYIPSSWKMAEVIMIPKAGKPPEQPASYRPISLLSIIGKLFERLYLKRLMPLIEERKLIPDHQFGFRQKHSTIEQIHKVVDVIEKALENKKVVSAVFLDVAQAFDKVWHDGLLSKLRAILPGNHVRLLESYLTDRKFRVRYEDSFSTFRDVLAGVPQGSVLGPI